MNLNQTRQSIKERISLGLNHGLKSLEGVLVKDAPLLNEFINYKCQYHDFKNLLTQNLLSYNQIEIGLNKIRVGVLDLVDQLTEEDIQEEPDLPGLRNTETQHRKNNFFQLLEIHFQNLEAIQIKLTNTTSNNTSSIDLRTGRYAFDFIYRDIFAYNYKNPSHSFKFKDDIIGHSNSFYFRGYQRFEVYMKTLQMILEFVAEEEMEQEFYLNILESILSTPEMQTIFYYSICGQNDKLKSILQKTRLIDKGVQGKLIEDKHWELWSKDKTGTI